MNFQIYILLAVVACALALPLPDEEVSVLQKANEMIGEAVTAADELIKKSEDTLSTIEVGLSNVVTNVTAKVESLPNVDVEKKLTKIVDEVKEAIEDEIPEVPKSLPVKAREEIEPVVPVAGVKSEPKEGVEQGESKSTASSPAAEDVANKLSSNKQPEVKPSIESTTAADATDKKNDVTTPASKPTESAQSKTTPKPEIAGDNKTESPETKATEAPATNTEAKTETPKDKHDHSTESSKSDESAESKESEESNESNKSK